MSWPHTMPLLMATFTLAANSYISSNTFTVAFTKQVKQNTELAKLKE